MKTQLKHYSLIQCTGSQVQHFLQGQLTANVTLASEIHAILSAYCDQRGRILASLYLYKREQDYFIIVAADLKNQLLQELDKYGRFSKIQLHNLDEQVEIYGLVGSPEQSGESAEQQLVRLPGHIERYLLIQPQTSQNAPNAPENYNTDSELHWQKLEIEQGIAWITSKTQGLFTPHQLNYQHLDVIDFKKGCYRGQEIVARMHYLGKLKQQLYRVETSLSSLQAGDEIVNADQRVVGHVINTVSNQEKAGSHALICFFNEEIKHPEQLRVKSTGLELNPIFSDLSDSI